MTETTPDWFRIVRHYPNQIGPTVPFLLGAIRDPVGEVPTSRASAQVELRDLLGRMYDEIVPDYGVNIQWCETTDAFVVAPIWPGRSLTWQQHTLNAHNVDTLAAELW